MEALLLKHTLEKQVHLQVRNKNHHNDMVKSYASGTEKTEPVMAKV